MISVTVKMAWKGSATEEFRRLDADGTGTLEGDEVLPLAEWAWTQMNPGLAPSGHDIRETAAKIIDASYINLEGAITLEASAGRHLPHP